MLHATEIELLKNQATTEKQALVLFLQAPRLQRIVPSRRQQHNSAQCFIANIPNGERVTMVFISTTGRRTRQECVVQKNGNVTFCYDDGTKDSVWVTFEGASNGLYWFYTTPPLHYHSHTTHFEHLLFQSAYTGELQFVKEVRLRTNIIGASDSRGFTAMSYAILGQRPKVVEYLLKECPDIIESVLPDGTNALHLAIYCGNMDIIRALLTPFANKSPRKIRANIAMQRMFSQKSPLGTPLDLASCADVPLSDLLSLLQTVMDSTNSINWDKLCDDYAEDEDIEDEMMSESSADKSGSSNSADDDEDLVTPPPRMDFISAKIVQPYYASLQGSGYVFANNPSPISSSPPSSSSSSSPAEKGEDFFATEYLS